MDMVKDRSNFPVKLASERALVHVLQVHKQPTLLVQYAATLEPTASRTISDYGKRVLAKLQDASDSESEVSEEEATEDSNNNNAQ